jgi:hypothetical protein
MYAKLAPFLPGDFAVGVSGLRALVDLIWTLSLHRQFASQLVIWHYSSRSRWVETDRLDLELKETCA